MNETKVNGKVVGKKYGVVLPLGTKGDTDDSCLDTPNVIYDGTTYKMWYSGYDQNRWRMHYATSEDGVTWTKYGVVLDVGRDGDSDSEDIDSPSVIYDGKTFHMWYTGYDGSHYRIFYATSIDGVNWKKHGVAIDLGVVGGYDTLSTSTPSVIFDGSTYKMWYSGYDGSDNRICYATSIDGITWIKHGNILLLDTNGKIDDEQIYYPSVIKDGSTYKMWYNYYDGSDYRIFYATSEDGISWIKHGIVTLLNDLDEYVIIHTDIPSVIFDGTIYKMWYRGFDYYTWSIYYTELSEIGLTYKN